MRRARQCSALLLPEKASGNQSRLVCERASEHFEVPDPVLEVWLSLPVDEVDSLPDAPERLRVAPDDWQALATEELGFGRAASTASDIGRVRFDQTGGGHGS